MTFAGNRPVHPRLSTGGLPVNPIVASLQEWAPILLASILALLPLVSGGAAQAQGTQQSATPAQPTGITDNTDSGDDDDLITNHTSITVIGVAANGATVALTASAARNGIVYGAAASSNADATDGRYTVSLNLATATTDDLAAIPSGSIDGSWNITARQTETDQGGVRAFTGAHRCDRYAGAKLQSVGRLSGRTDLRHRDQCELDQRGSEGSGFPQRHPLRRRRRHRHPA